MNQQDDWDALQDMWRSTNVGPAPDMDAMIAAARGKARNNWAMLALEWLLACGAAVLVFTRLDFAAMPVYNAACWGFALLVMALMMGRVTWLRLRYLGEPADVSLRAWLELRRRRCEAELRMVRVERAATLALVPALALLLALEPAHAESWRKWVAYSSPAVLLLVSWIWSGRRAARNRRELDEVKRLDADWLE